MEEMDEGDPAARPPPRKKACVVRKQTVNKGKRGKENKVPCSRGKEGKEKGKIILVGAHMLAGDGGEHSHEQLKQNKPKQNTASLSFRA